MMLLDGIMVHRDQYLIYCSTLDRWALLLWGKVCVLKSGKSNINFIRKQENWLLGIRKSMITVFALLQVKSGDFKSIHRHDGVDLLCLTVTIYPCMHSSHSFPLFHGLSLSVYPSVDHLPFSFWNICVSMVSEQHHRSTLLCCILIEKTL